MNLTPSPKRLSLLRPRRAVWRVACLVDKGLIRARLLSISILIALCASGTNFARAETLAAPSGSLVNGFTDEKFFPSVQYNYSEFGDSLTASGDIALVHQAYYNTNNVYIFRRTAIGWLEEKRIPTQKDYSYPFSSATDGTTVVVGEPYLEPTGKTDEGDVSVYRWNGSNWGQETLVYPSADRQAGARFGYAVAVDGDTLVVGAPYWDLLNDGQGNRYDDVGRLYVFIRGTDAVWRLQSTLDNSLDPISLREDDRFGYRVQVEGDTLLGQYYEGGGVEVWDWSGTAWNRSGNLTWSGSLSSLAFDGEFVALGQASDGEVAIWWRAPGTTGAFTFLSTLTPPDGATNNDFGYSVRFSGNRLAVGAPDDTRGALYDAGAAYAYLRDGLTWTPEAKVMADPANNNDYFGKSVALSNAQLIAGAPGYDGITNDGGTFYTYDLPQYWQVVVNTAGAGNVTSNPVGIDCGSDCSETYPGGTTVTLKAEATAGSTFLGWSGDCTGPSLSCTLPTITANQQVTASFSGPATYLISELPQPSNRGAVDCVPNPAVHGGTSRCVADAKSGSLFLGWGGHCEGQSGTSCVLRNVTSARTAIARFGEPMLFLPTPGSWRAILGGSD